MDSEQLKARTKNFSLQIISFFKGLQKTSEAQILGKQLLRSATSIAANYRAACRSRSGKEFYAKLCIVVEEADETVLWLELLFESGIEVENKEILNEAKELLYIFSATRKSHKHNNL